LPTHTAIGVCACTHLHLLALLCMRAVCSGLAFVCLSLRLFSSSPSSRAPVCASGVCRCAVRVFLCTCVPHKRAQPRYLRTRHRRRRTRETQHRHQHHHNTRATPPSVRRTCARPGPLPGLLPAALLCPRGPASRLPRLLPLVALRLHARPPPHLLALSLSSPCLVARRLRPAPTTRNQPAAFSRAIVTGCLTAAEAERFRETCDAARALAGAAYGLLTALCVPHCETTRAQFVADSGFHELAGTVNFVL
jgi:hypothetical protein